MVKPVYAYRLLDRYWDRRSCIFGWSGTFMNMIVKSRGGTEQRRISKLPWTPCAAMEIRRAVARREFLLVYQPMVDLHTGQITSCEALLRWSHPKHGVILPADFLLLAERMRLMPRVGTWVLYEALMQATTWPDQISVAVNLSATQFLAGNLPQVVREALMATGLIPSRLELEITETIEPLAGSSLWDTLHQLQRLGVRLSLDDFGIGHSSVHRLRSFAFDKIKIDRSFVEGFPDRVEHLRFIRAVIALGTELGITTTAEGAETRSEVERLRLEGCSEVQSFFFSPALSSDEIREFLVLAQRRRLTSALLDRRRLRNPLYHEWNTIRPDAISRSPIHRPR
jgi:EAL domain-containing protein (putative c-di-GMP-specific phosphodiesterase class I)